jgi:heterodisulfide reductase subunit C
MRKYFARHWLPRLFAVGLLLGLGSPALLAEEEEWLCPDCYRCDHGCYKGTNEYGFKKCALNPDGSCNPDGGEYCCEFLQ